MSGMIIKYPTQHWSGEYNWIDDTALVKSDIDTRYFIELDIINRIKENKMGYFDFNKNLVDIGANFGGYSMLLDFKNNYCFEGNKRFACMLYANMLIKDKYANTEVYNCVLSDKVEEIGYNGWCCEGCGSPDEVRGDLYSDMHKVKTSVLDSFGLTDVGLIKIDVEGFEEKVLRGGIGTIVRNNYPPILFECWDVGYYNMTQEKHDSMFNFLRGLGYKIIEYWGDFETHLAIHK